MIRRSFLASLFTPLLSLFAPKAHACETSERDEFFETARRRFKLAAEAEQQIRRDALDDLRFCGGEQWPHKVW